MKGFNKMEWIRIILKGVMWIFIIGFGCNFIMQTISYSFYKGAKPMRDISCQPIKLQMNDQLTGYGYNMDSKSDHLIIFFGGSYYTAYNSVGKFGAYYDCPFISVDYYGTQESKGKMNLKSMKQTALEAYTWITKAYPNRQITVMGHSYGCGMAAYLASERTCNNLILVAAYRDLSDLYNKIIPIFWGPAKVFISNNIQISAYAKNTACIGSLNDKTLDTNLQHKVCHCYENATLQIFKDITHEDYLTNEQVIDYIRCLCTK